MASTITAGNATNGLGISSDNTGILQLKSGTGSGTTALTLDASQNAAFAGTVTATNITNATGTIYPLISATAVASTTGATIDFTGIPSTAKRVTVMFSGVSTSGTTGFGVQAGTSGGVVATGYLGSTSRVGAPTSATLSTGFIFNSNSAADISHGDLILVNITGNTWVARGTVGQSNVGQAITVAGNIALSGVLDRVRITTGNGTDTFDAGSINIMWE